MNELSLADVVEAIERDRAQRARDEASVREVLLSIIPREPGPGLVTSLTYFVARVNALRSQTPDPEGLTERYRRAEGGEGYGD